MWRVRARGWPTWDWAHPQTGEPRAVFDLAWPSGLRAGLSQPAAVLLCEDAATLRMAGEAGFRCFTEAEAFGRYLVATVPGGASWG